MNHIKKPKKLNGSKNQIYALGSISDSGLCSLKAVYVLFTPYQMLSQKRDL
jgi:hypothetical protein